MWQSLTPGAEETIEPTNQVAYVVVVFILFFLVYIPVHAGFLAEELVNSETKGKRVLLIVSYVGTGIAGIWPLLQRMV